MFLVVRIRLIMWCVYCNKKLYETCRLSVAICELLWLVEPISHKWSSKFHCFSNAAEYWKVLKQSPSGIYLFKVNNGNTKTVGEICSFLSFRCLFLLTFNSFHTLLWCLHCWLWTSNKQMGRYRSRNEFKKITLHDLIQFCYSSTT